MHVQLVLPGLMWPGAMHGNDLTQGLALPALEKLLGCATLTRMGRRNPDEALGELFGLDDALQVAALRHLGEAVGVKAQSADPTQHFLCADPVHLHFAREHMLLTDASDLNVQPHEADELVAALNAFLSEAEPEMGGIEAPAPDRWYLRLPAEDRTHFFPLADVLGRPVSHFSPEGGRARHWARLTNELQVILHNHPVNQTREAKGLPTINSVWLWGAGSLPDIPSRPDISMHADSVLARGLGQHCGMTLKPAHAPVEQDAVIVIDDLLAPALRLDLGRWRSTLQELEHACLAPLLKQLRSARVKRLHCVAPGDQLSLTFQATSADSYKFWRRPRRLEEFICTT